MPPRRTFRYRLAEMAALRAVRFPALALTLVALVRCGGATPEPHPSPTPATPAATDTPAVGAPATSADGGAGPSASPAPAAMSKPWRQMSLSEKKLHMKTEVTPRMAAVFQAWNAKGFEDFNCITCHGPTAKTGNFAMPSSALPHLDPADDFKRDREKHPAATKFMFEKVMPEMAAALGLAAYDPKTQKGFGCGGCHKLEH